MPVARQRVVDSLLRMGLEHAAERAVGELPDPVGTDELAAFCERIGVSQGELIDRMGGSP